MTKRFSIKRLMLIIVALLAVAVTAVGVRQSVLAQVGTLGTYEVTGGKVTFDFEQEQDMDRFDRYAEFDRLPSIVDGRLLCWSLAEQKIIYTGAKFGDVDVSVDIGTINDHGKFDAGFYLAAGDAVSGTIDAINAWNVNLERGADQDRYILRLHRFDQGYGGYRKEVLSLHLPLNVVHLRAVIKGRELFVFVNRQDTPVMTYDFGAPITGYVGLRSFYSPNWFDNLTVIGEPLARDTAELDRLTEEAERIDVAALTQVTADELTDALHAAREAKSEGTQYEIDAATDALRAAIKGTTVRRTYDEFVAAVTAARAYTNPDGAVYTVNTWQSLQRVLVWCEQYTEQTDEQTLSYWTSRIEYKIACLMPYQGGAV